MLHIDRTTPGHVRRDTNTGEPLMPPPSTSDDVLTNGAPDNVSEGTSELWETSGGQDMFARALGIAWLFFVCFYKVLFSFLFLFV